MSNKTSSKHRIEDSDYVERAKLLEDQDEFARNNLVDNLLVELITTQHHDDVCNNEPTRALRTAKRFFKSNKV